MNVPVDEPAAQIPSPLRVDRAHRAKQATWRIALFAFIVSSILWLGTAHIRAIIGNDLLKIGTIEFEDYFSPDAEREIYRLLSFASISIIVNYCIATVSGAVFLATSPYKLKEHGWLMMSAVLFYLFLPVEVFTMYLDSKMVYREFFTTADNQAFRELFVARVGALAGAPYVATLCYYTTIALVVFQPLRKKPVN